MIDIVSVGEDIGIFDTDTARAANILSVQVGALEYAPNLGIDLKYFLDDKFKFQNSSFRSYLIQVLSNYGINVATVGDSIENLFIKYTFNLSPAKTSGGLIAR